MSNRNIEKSNARMKLSFQFSCEPDNWKRRIRKTKSVFIKRSKKDAKLNQLQQTLPKPFTNQATQRPNKTNHDQHWPHCWKIMRWNRTVPALSSSLPVNSQNNDRCFSEVPQPGNACWGYPVIFFAGRCLAACLFFFRSSLLRCDLLAKKVPGRAPFSQHIIIRNWTYMNWSKTKLLKSFRPKFANKQIK